MKRITLWLLLLVIVGTTVFSQVRSRSRPLPREKAGPQNLIDRQTQFAPREYDEIFRSVQMGISASDVNAFSKYFGPQVNVRLPKGEGGYYSGNQAHYVLQNYLTGRTIHSFTLSSPLSPQSSPYATGQGKSEVRGSVENIQVYVALSRVSNQWVISQITVY